MIFDAIKQAQLIEAYGSNRLNELPTRVYTSERFFLIKSHFFRDWTVRQAIEDANEAVKTLMQEATVGLIYFTKIFPGTRLSSSFQPYRHWSNSFICRLF